MLALQPPATSKNECRLLVPERGPLYPKAFRQVRCLIPYRSFHYGIEVLQGFGGKALAQASLFQRANIQVRRVGLPKPCTSSRSLLSVPATWVTVYTGDIGNTLASNGLGAHSTRVLSLSKK